MHNLSHPLLGWPNGLSIDYEAQRLYWADAHQDRIEMSDFFGGNRVSLILKITHPFGLTVVSKIFMIIKSFCNYCVIFIC